MSFEINAAQARMKSRKDLYIFDECQTIMRAIIAASENNEYEITISDGTAMTESTPERKFVGSVQNPTISVGDTLIIDGNTISLGSTGTNLNSIICDINDANVDGIVASKENGYLVITITAKQTAWATVIENGTANSSVGFVNGTYSIDYPESVKFHDVWQGVVTDRALFNQMDQVVSYFRNLGYKIERVSNTQTSKTFSWYLYW